jgi:GxxExxY protein
MQEIPFVAQAALELEYKGTLLTQIFRPDFICYGKIIVEIKALDYLIDVHKSQVMNYLNATKFGLGLLINFGHYPRLEYERVANTCEKLIG